MTDKRGYNGWTNYSTWNLALWLGNDEGSDSYWREQAQEAYDLAKPTRSMTRLENAALALSDILKADVEENTPTVTGVSGFYAEVLNAAICEVNYYEVAMSLLSDIELEEGK